MNDTVEIELRDGLAVSPVWEAHKRGKNWLAVCTGPNAAKVTRAFHRPVYSEQAYDPDLFRPGVVLEIAADYTNSSGRKQPTRAYLIPTEDRTDARIVCRRFETLAKAMQAAKEGAPT